MNGSVSMSAEVLQQLARQQGGGSGSQLVLGTTKNGVRVFASEADLADRDLAVLQWHIKTARKAGLAVPDEVLSARDRLRTELRQTRRGKWWFQ
jgi:hypothetical protein